MLSFQAKLIWAHQQLDALRDDLMTFGRSKPCVVVYDFDRKTLYHTWRVRGQVNTPPASISLRLGDTLFNFRGVLDHLAWQLVSVSGGKPGRRTALPICNTRAIFDSKPVQAQMAGMLARVQAAIERLQPYNGRDPHGTDRFLLLLDSLGNVEKHRHFNLIVASLEAARLITPNPERVTEFFIHKGPIEDGTILARCKGNVDMNFDAVFGVAFGERGNAAGESVDKVILNIELAVEAVLQELACFLPRG